MTSKLLCATVYNLTVGDVLMLGHVSRIFVEYSKKKRFGYCLPLVDHAISACWVNEVKRTGWTCGGNMLHGRVSRGNGADEASHS